MIRVHCWTWPRAELNVLKPQKLSSTMSLHEIDSVHSHLMAVMVKDERIPSVNIVKVFKGTVIVKLIHSVASNIDA
jgi:hypothetical protein